MSITLILICAAFGRKLLALLRVETESTAERSAFGIALGFGAVAYLILGIGLLGLLRPVVLGILMILVGVWSVREFVAIISELVRGVRQWAKAKPDVSGLLVSSAGAFAVILVLLRALAPPSALDWDGLSYHLAVPKIYLSHHKIFYLPFTSHSNLPFLLEMLYTLGLSFGSIGAAKLFHFATYAVSTISVYCLARRHLNGGVGRFAALIFLTVPVVMWEAGNAYADIATAMYVTLAAYAVLNWEQSRSGVWLMVCGIMCGFALSTKVFAVVPTIALCLWILFASKRFRPALAVGLLALVVGSPWYIKSWVYTGNPVYPFLYSIFGGKYWNASDASAYSAAQSAFGMGHSLVRLLQLPWNLTVNGNQFFDDPANPKPFSLIGGVFLAFIPLGVLAGGRGKAIGRLAFVCAAYGVAWFLLMQQVRYLIGIIPLLAVLAAWGLDAVNHNWKSARHVANVFLGVCVLLSLLTGLLVSLPSDRAAMGFEPASEYLSKSLDEYDAISYANDNLPPDAKVVFFDEVRGFYLDREYMWGNPGHHEMTPWGSFHSGADMVRYFKGQGFDYALINWRLARYSGEDLLHAKYIPECIGRGLMREIYSSKGVSLYELVAE